LLAQWRQVDASELPRSEIVRHVIEYSVLAAHRHVFGVLGWVFVKLECEPAPLLLGFILGPLMEENLRRALLLSRGDPTVFFTRPLSLGMLVAAGLLLLIIVLPTVRRKREEAFHEEAA
jgi:TctA family transporter